MALITSQGCYVHVTTAAVAGITGTYYYFVVAASSTKKELNGRMVEGLPSAISAVASPLSQSVTISWTPTSHIDPQVDKWNIYRTTNGGLSTNQIPEQQDFFLLATVAVATNSYVDTIDDATNWYFSGDTSNRLRFVQNIPPAFNIAVVYGERVFAAGFDPINSSTVTTTGASTLVTLAAGTWPDGVKGCYFRQDSDDGVYEIKARPTPTTLTLDRVYTASGGAAGSGKHYTIFRNPNEVYFSEMNSPDAWGKDGEFNRLKLPFPPDKAVTGLFPFQGSLLVFTATEIWAIYGKGPNRFDVKKLTDAACVDAGAVSQDTIMRVGNECHFLSLDGPASIDSVGTAINVTLYGIPLNTDWMDALTEAETKLACAGTDGRAVWYSVPSAAGQTLNSKTFRFERDTKGWFEETEMCPLRFIRQDGTDGQLQQLFYLQDRFVHKPQTGTLDLVSAALSVHSSFSDNTNTCTPGQIYPIQSAGLHANVLEIDTTLPHLLEVGDTVVVAFSGSPFNAVNGTYTVLANTYLGSAMSFTVAAVHADITTNPATGTIQYSPFTTLNGGLEQCWARFYDSTGAFVATRRITSNTVNTITWSETATLPGSGDVNMLSGYVIEIGNVGWKWLTKTNEVPAHRETADQVHTEFVTNATATLLHTDLIDDVEASNIQTISCANKVAYQYDVSGSNRNYATRLGSRNGAVLRDVTLVGFVEAGTN